MKFVNLTTPAWVNGVLRYPHEGAIPLTNVEGNRLIKADAAEDVSADFGGESDDATATLTADPVVADASKKGDAK